MVCAVIDHVEKHLPDEEIFCVHPTGGSAVSRPVLPSAVPCGTGLHSISAMLLGQVQRSRICVGSSLRICPLKRAVP